MPDSPSRRAAHLAGLAAAVLIVASCAPSATLVSDPVFSELYLSDRQELRRLETAAGEAGFELRTVTLDAVPTGPDAVDAALERADSGQPVVLSPLLAAVGSGRERPRDAEGAGVLLLGGARDAPPADAVAAAGDGEVSRAVHDRVPAFTELGQRIAGNSIVAYFRTDTPARRAELDAFRDGLGEDVESARFVVFESAPDDTAIREELFRVRSPDVELVAAFLGPQNRVILDEVSGMGRTPPLVATEDLGPAAAYEAFAAYSVERDYAAAVEAFLSGRRGTILVNARLVDRDADRGDRVP